MDGSLSNAFEGLQVNLKIPDLWQQDAIRGIAEGDDVILAAPTGAGKTFVFESLVNRGNFPPAGKQAVYTVPTRALANDKWREWKIGGWNVGIATGDLAENLDAPVIVATLETQREKMMAGEGPFLLVIDEYQMIADRRRGLGYELAVALAPPERTQLLLMSGSVGNPRKVAEWLERLGRKVRVVETVERPVPLDEMPVEALPRTPPKRFSNFWQRMALSTLLSNYGPLLIFAPHRKSAEKIAWKIAGALPEDNPIEFKDHELRQTCSADLSRLLRKRIAWHHSGLTFGERAAIVEPLAKAGQLRVVVATMGLAAGINFSVRSVFVAGTTYNDGPFQREVAPDELLQMFGRAGRRGLDEFGYVICGRQSPRLGDARPLDLRRSNDIDWPSLLRKMHLAVEKSESPFDAAREIRDRLFSKQDVYIGFRGSEKGGLSEDSFEKPLFQLKPIRRQVMNFNGEWEATQAGREAESRLAEAYGFSRGKYRNLESISSIVEQFLPPGTRLCRLDEKGGGKRLYGCEIVVASEQESGNFLLSKNIRKLLSIPKSQAKYDKEEALILIPELMAKSLQPGRFHDWKIRGKALYLRCSLGDVSVKIYRDSGDRLLFSPQQRSEEIKSETHFQEGSTGEIINPVTGSPAHAWRKLGLIDDRGIPTNRGILCSFFQHGEGLAVAAALEDVHYPIDEMILHFANLRAGHRFELDDAGTTDAGSERLSAACRQAYGAVDFEGYLRLGLPSTYGEGAAEIIQAMLEGRLHVIFSRGKKYLEFGQGDVERAFIEWLSFLRQIRNAPGLDGFPRWLELKSAASRELQKRDGRSPLGNLPAIPQSILQKPPQNRIHYSRL